MTDPSRPHAHVSADQVADLLEGLLTDTEAAAVAAHLDTCPDCAALRAQVEQVSALLADAALEPVEVPTDVVARLDAALAAEQVARTRPAERVAPVVDLAARRRGRVRQGLAGLVAAAAVVTGFVVVGDVLSGSGGDDASQAGSGDTVASAEDSAPETTEGGGRAQPTATLPEVDAARLGPSVRAAYAQLRVQSMTSVPADTTCSPGLLRRSDVDGRVGPDVAYEGQALTLVARGPERRSTVILYRCPPDLGSVEAVTSVRVDLR